MNASPAKRRALASLDVNALTPGSGGSKLAGKLAAASASPVAPREQLSRDLSPSPRPASELEGRKRPLGISAHEQQPAKKACLSPDLLGSTLGKEVSPRREVKPGDAVKMVCRGPDTREDSVSPAPSSIFDTSVIDTSQATNMTESDMETALVAAALPSNHVALLASLPPRRVLTREESRHKAEILKLRLSLANYKLRTGQADVPLEQLEQQRRDRGLPEALVRGGRRRTPLPAGPRQALETRSGPSFERRDSGSSRSSISSQAHSSSAASLSAEEEAEEEDSSEGPRGTRPSSPERESVLPPMPSGLRQGVATPRKRRPEGEREEERLTSSALRGGAASGLLSLALAKA